METELKEKIALLQEKYESMGQDIMSYLEGLLYADYLTYWDYIHLDTLLSLQNPKTSFKDEKIFIVYHQITELYFKLCLHELQQLSEKEVVDIEELKLRVVRVNRYFEALTKSFEIMVQGMDKEQFLKFRMSLLPASGFQSAQYRMIEIYSTDFINLVSKEKRDLFAMEKDNNIAAMFEFIYWKQGATEAATGKKTLTLLQFEEKYSDTLIQLAEKMKTGNVWAKYMQLNVSEREDKVLIKAMRQLDLDVNVNWPLQHYRSAVRYLHKAPEDVAATGGTNWQKYLPPKFQKRIFYPTLWQEEEMEAWGSLNLKS